MALTSNYLTDGHLIWSTLFIEGTGILCAFSIILIYVRLFFIWLHLSLAEFNIPNELIL